MTTGDRDQKLESALRALADETSGGASPRVLSVLLAEVRSLRKPAASWRGWALAAIAAAAGIFLLVVAPKVQEPLPLPRLEPVVQQAVAPAPEAAEPAPDVPRPAVQRAVLRSQALTPWYYNQALPPARSSQVLRVKVSRDLASSFGVLAAGSTGLVQADLLIGEDGMARAIRFVQ
jgi:hypothetical protein